MFYYGLDKGPDNVGLAGRVRNAVRPIPNVSFTIRWCTFHSCQLVCLGFYETMNNWEWDSTGVEILEECETPISDPLYLSCVKTCANTLRSQGIAKIILVGSLLRT